MAKGAETLEGLIAVLLGGLLVNRSNGRLGVTCGSLGGLVDEILDEIALIFGQEEELGLLDDIAKVVDKDLTLLGELARRLGEGARGEGTVQGDIDLFVLRLIRMRQKHHRRKYPTH